MRRYLLAPALLLFLFVPRAEAASSVLCGQLRNANIQPVSQNYTKRVLDRAEQGLTNARGTAVDADFERYLPGWIRRTGSVWAGLIDSDLQITTEQRELTDVTACLHIDLMLIECKIDDVRQELRVQLERGGLLSVRMLLDLVEFLNQRRSHLEKGALNPLYSDPQWGQRYLFDPPSQVWCCPTDGSSNTCKQGTGDECSTATGIQFETLEMCTQFGCQPPAGEDPKTSAICPFNSDYAPPFQSGFGCDIETMMPRQDYPPVQAEMEGLQISNDEIKEYRDTANEFLNVQRDLDELFGNQSTTPPQPKPRQHLNAFGCGWTGGYCTEDLDRKCSTDAECTGVGTCEVPEKVCENNRAIRCNTDANCGSAAPCVEGIELPAVRELRGAFSYKKDEVSILSEFLGVRVEQEISRTFQSELKLPNEYREDEVDARNDRIRSEQNPLVSFFRGLNRVEVPVWSRIQARSEAFIFADAVDSQLEIAQSLKGLRSSVSELSKLASEKTGVRQFVGRYAYFIRRSCTLRPCNEMLEQVIRIVTTDECFPYTMGLYLSDTPESPRWEKCKQAAGIQ
jgi:hypothetical protein